MTSRLATVLRPLLAGFLLIGASAFAQPQEPPGSAEPQDPPARVGRLSFIEGTVQQRSAGEPDWARASLNYPVTTGFALATREGGRAEIQVGSMAVRIGSNSELDVNTLADHGATLILAQGEINLRLGQLPAGDQIEIVTPRGAAHIVSAGHYHFDAGSTERPTQVAVFDGRIEVPREGGPTTLASGQSALISSDEPSGLTLAASSRDPLDDWALARDRRPSRTARARTVSPEMTGGGDLDESGIWRQDPRYGDVWYPSGQPAGWAPYRYGHWAWVPPWGWNWIDDAPWGFAPFHYGRWVYGAFGWGWVPGGYIDYPVYAPALVGFVGFGPSVAWFPLAPFEVFVPSFFVSIDFVRRVNITNVNIVNINITRVNGNIVVNNTTNITINNFANRQFTTTVSTASFASGQSVNRVMVTSTTHIGSTSPVSFAPTNVTVTNATTVAGWHEGTTGANAAGASVRGDPKTGQKSQSSLTSGGTAQTPTVERGWRNGPTGASTASGGHKGLTGDAPHSTLSASTPNRAHTTGSSMKPTVTPTGPVGPHGPSAPSMHANGAFSPMAPWNPGTARGPGSMMRGGPGPMMHGGPPMNAAARPVGPTGQFRGFASGGGG